jgi:hypothetical protein
MAKFNLGGANGFAGKRVSKGFGMQTGPNRGPVRQKKEPNLIQSMLGVLIGIGLILLAPLVMSAAANQHRAKDFNKAPLVDASTITDGYVKFQGVPTYVDSANGVDCLRSNCTYQEEQEQVLMSNLILECGNVTEDKYTTVLRQNGIECDEDGDCETCYDVEKLQWETQDTNETINPMKVGAYTVTPSGGAEYVNLQEEIVPQDGDYVFEGDERSVYSFFIMPSSLVVAGNSIAGSIQAPEKLTYVLSSLGIEETASIMKERDSESRMTLWLITFGMLFFGFALMFGPLHWFGRQMRFIPFIGGFLKDGSGFMVLVASFALALPFWILLLVLATILKIWWLVSAAYLFLLVFGIVMFIKNRKKMGGAVKKVVDKAKNVV